MDTSPRTPHAPTSSLIAMLAGLAVAVAVPVPQPSAGSAQYARKTNVAHRGASAYAPEHTMAAYALAVEQGADYVEQDLQITRDGVLVALHDGTLERTTNVEEIFPERARTVDGRKTWPVSDFTLAEIRRLDAGAWFDPEFAGQRVPTWDEAIGFLRGKAGLFPEMKDPDAHRGRGVDIERLVLQTLRTHGLEQPGADPRTPVIIQSFSADNLRRMRALGSRLPLVLLISDRDHGRDAWLSDEGLTRAKTFVDGIGPAKGLLLADPTLATRARARGLSITPYTFRSADRRPGGPVAAEMARFLYDIGVDAVFTDNPDQFPRR